jgi:hypothetical protein
MAIWMVALKPKPVAIENTPLSSTKVIPQANQASAVSDAANAKLQSAAAAADGSAAPTPAAAAGTRQTATPRTGQAPANAHKLAATSDRKDAGARSNAQIERAVARGKVVVLLFWNSNASDDIATRGALREIDRRGGKVLVRVIPIADVAKYTTVTRGVKIAQSPTTVIIGRKGRTRVIAGLTEPHELQQAVGDALAGR